jgi:hypothetical protein
MLDKTLFVDTINVMKKQREHDSKCSDAFKIILPSDFVTNYDNSLLFNQLTIILESQFNDEGLHSWIDYFIDELDFGQKYKLGCATYKNGENIDISTAEKLYDFLVKEMELKK